MSQLNGHSASRSQENQPGPFSKLPGEFARQAPKTIRFTQPSGYPATLRDAVSHHDHGAVGLATLLALSVALITAMLLLVTAVDALATLQRGQHAADIIAIAAMERSPLAGGTGSVDQAVLTQLATSQGVTLRDVDTTSWPLEVGIRVRAGPHTPLARIWAGPECSSRAEVIPPPGSEDPGQAP